MITSEPLLVTLVKLVDDIPVPPSPAKRPRRRPKVHSDRLFLKALIIMLVRHLHNVHALLAVLANRRLKWRCCRFCSRNKATTQRIALGNAA